METAARQVFSRSRDGVLLTSSEVELMETVVVLPLTLIALASDFLGS